VQVPICMCKASSKVSSRTNAMAYNSPSLGERQVSLAGPKCLHLRHIDGSPPGTVQQLCMCKIGDPVGRCKARPLSIGVLFV